MSKFVVVVEQRRGKKSAVRLGLETWTHTTQPTGKTFLPSRHSSAAKKEPGNPDKDLGTSFEAHWAMGETYATAYDGDLI